MLFNGKIPHLRGSYSPPLGKINRAKGSQTYMNNHKKKKTIDKRQAREKALVIDQLKKVPIVSIACERSGVSRATYYRWCAEDEVFEVATQDAIIEGEKLMNDLGESQLMTLMRDKSWQAIKYYLEKRNPKFMSQKAADNDSKIIRIIKIYDKED